MISPCSKRSVLAVDGVRPARTHPPVDLAGHHARKVRIRRQDPPEKHTDRHADPDHAQLWTFAVQTIQYPSQRTRDPCHPVEHDREASQDIHREDTELVHRSGGTGNDDGGEEQTHAAAEEKAPVPEQHGRARQQGERAQVAGVEYIQHGRI